MKFVRDFLWSLVLPVLLFCGLIYPGGTGLANVALFLAWFLAIVPILGYFCTGPADWAKMRPRVLPDWWHSSVRVSVVAIAVWAGCFALAVAMIVGFACVTTMLKRAASPAATA